jgi:hypothetical protein
MHDITLSGGAGLRERALSATLGFDADATVENEAVGLWS